MLVAFATSARAQVSVYTNDADFERGTLLNVNHDNPGSNQLQLSTDSVPFRFLNVATTNGDGPRQGTIVRINVDTGEVVGEYRTAPNRRPSNPSHTAVDVFGNVWAGNRDEFNPLTGGSVVKIGMIVGGTRCDSDGTPNPIGEYLSPPFDYSTAVDRDGDGLIRTSRGLGDVLSWPNISDGDGGEAGGPAIVEDAIDELVLVYQRTTNPLIRHISVDEQSDVWVGGYPGSPTGFEKLDQQTGAVLSSVQAPGCGGYGGLVDSAGVIWSASRGEDELMRFDPSAPGTSQCISIANSYGVGIDSQGNIWNSQRENSSIAKVAPDGSVIFSDKPIPGAMSLRGLAVTCADDNIYVADGLLDVVFRLNSSGDVVGAPIPVGDQPTGVSVDSNGMVWVSCRLSSEVHRIDPSAGANGAVDMIVPLTPGSGPDNYSDMTGAVTFASTLDIGFWEVMRDGGSANQAWGRVSWTSSEPNGASVVVEARSSNNPASLPGLPYARLKNAVRTNLTGRFIQVRVRFEKSATTGESPILYDLSIQRLQQDSTDDCPTVDRRTPGSLLLYPEFDSRVGTVSLLTVSNVAGAEVDVEFVYINGEDCLEFNRTEALTANDTLSLIAAMHNPNQEFGYVYAFAKDPATGEPIQHNGLVGQVMVLDGLDAFEYAVNAVSFAAVAGGATTDVDGDGVRDLDGVEYAMAPDEILIPRFMGQGQANNQVGEDDGPQDLVASQLLLVALSGGPAFTTTVDFLIYNDNEEQFSSEYSFNCWEKTDLLDISNIFRNDFLQASTNNAPGEVLGAPSMEAGWFRIDGALAQSSTTSIQDPAIYAVLIEMVGGYAVADLPFELCSQDNGDLLAAGLSGDQ